MVAVRDRLCVRGMVPRRQTRVKPLVGTGLPRSRSVQPEASRAVQYHLHRCPRCPQRDCRASRDAAARPPRPAGNPQGHTGAGCLQAGRAGAALVRRRRASGPAGPRQRHLAAHDLPLPARDTGSAGPIRPLPNRGWSSGRLRKAATCSSRWRASAETCDFYTISMDATGGGLYSRADHPEPGE